MFSEYYFKFLNFIFVTFICIPSTLLRLVGYIFLWTAGAYPGASGLLSFSPFRFQN
jgi:hypothetical protein